MEIYNIFYFNKNNKIMKKISIFAIFCLFFCIFSTFFAKFCVLGEIETAQNLVEYNGEVKHVFTHCLLADPALALSPTNSMSRDYARDCITKDEFKSILKHLYKNNYVLISPHKLYDVQDNRISRKKLYLPSGKKPLIFSFDDVNYDHKKVGKGMVDKLILDSNGEVATQTTTNGKTVISHDNEFVPILNSFVKSNPDFSLDGAKGVLCLTGYDGILGYRTQSKNSKNREQEIDECKKVVKKLKSDGWEFACHSYGHYHMKKISLEKFQEELKLWNNEVVPLVGKTDIYVYPYGEWEILDGKNISQKHKLLTEDGFKLFCGVGVQSFLTMFPKGFDKSEQILFMDRCPLDGYTLKNKGEDLESLFPCDDVIDWKLRK